MKGWRLFLAAQLLWVLLMGATWGLLIPALWSAFAVPWGLPPANGVALWGLTFTGRLLVKGWPAIKPPVDAAARDEKRREEMKRDGLLLVMALVFLGLARLLAPFVAVGGLHG